MMCKEQPPVRGHGSLEGWTAAWLRASFEGSKSERKCHDRPTWRRPCWRGAARGARATAGGDRRGDPWRAPAAAGRTSIDEGLCGSPQKLIKSTASELWPEKSPTPPSMAQACWLQLRVSARCGHT